MESAAMDATAESIREGSRVFIPDLECTPHADHNGKYGIVIGAFHSTSTGCWPVQVEGRPTLILALRPENILLAKLQRKCEPRHFSHLAHDGTVTLLGFGSLVEKSSAGKSFSFKNFRLGSITGYQRIFNRSDWININNGISRVETGETCSVALMRTASAVVSRVALMDVNTEEGLAGFLHRETTYEIFEVPPVHSCSHAAAAFLIVLQVPYVDDCGKSGIALACGECSDEDAQVLWGADNWYSQRAIGQCSYISPPPTPMPMRPEVYSVSGDLEGPAYPSDAWMPITRPKNAMDKASGKYMLPVRPWVYPAPGYLQSIYRAHVLAGLADSLLDTTLLMDRSTVLRTYLKANPTLKAFVMD